MTLRSRLISASAIFFLVLPIAGNAKSLNGIIDTKANTMSRAKFLSYAFQALELTKEDGKCTLPYTRVPLGQRGMLCAAQTDGALTIFGTSKQYPLNKAITRGEAIIVLTALTDQQGRGDVSAYTDVKTATEKEAVTNAVVFRWMVPTSSTVFGMKKTLTATEALTLLNAASGAAAAEEQSQKITINLGDTAPAASLPREDLFLTVWDILKRDYIKNDTIDNDEAAYKAIEGLVDSLNDPYTTFFRPVGATDFQSQIKGEVSGIGASIEDIDGVITIISPLPGSPAERAGILPGDQLIEVNGTPLKGLGVEKAVLVIRGEKGTTAILKIRRNGGEMTVNVLRDIITIPEIAVTWQGDIAVVQLLQFGETTEKRIRGIFSEISAKNPKGIILDLRNNGGGLLNAADIVMSNFTPKGTLVAKVQSRRQTTEEKTKDEPTINANTKVVVLVNKGSASASEIVAGALQDLKRATIVGATTFGKGTVQEVIGFTTGEALKVTIAEWLTPLGRRINGVGITPDVVVESLDRDEQMRRALDILR